MSKEHLVSKCLFPGDVTVKGLPWCKDKEKTIGIGNLTSGFLCRHHNSALSELDSASKQTLDTLIEAVDLYERRKNININLSGRPGLPVDVESRSNRPTEELVRIVFGLERFKPPKGLYRIAVTGANLDLADGHVHLTTKSRDGRLAAAEFRLWGLPFFLSLVDEPIRWEGGNLLRGEHKQWFSTWDLKNRQVKSHLMTFTYPNI
jgi:hypothetical protein